MIAWLNSNSGFVMAVLTLIYVFATIRILDSNKKATETANEQLKEMKEHFYEEFRPILTVKSKCWDTDKITFIITNIGNRAAKNICFEYQTQFFKDGKNEMVAKGQGTHEVLSNNRLLQPDISIETVLENYNTQAYSTIDLILTYESFHKSFTERICVHGNQIDCLRIRTLG